MSAYDDQFHVLADSRWLRFKRDVRLLAWLGKFLVMYLTIARKVRKEFKRKRALGEPFFID